MDEISNSIEVKPDKPNIIKKKVTKKVRDRVFSGKALIFHDLFKLTVAKMKKNMSWQPIPADEYTEIEHVHFFHTYDSSGRKQEHSTSVGGHFHIMKVVQNEDGVPTVKCDSGPVKYIRQKNKFSKRYERVLVPVNDVDKHTHDSIYLQSNELSVRKINEEAAKVIGSNAALTQKPKGLDLA